MGYRKMDKRDLWRIYRRWRDRQSLSRIAESENRDRKTVREYIEGLEAVGLRLDGAPAEEQEFFRLIGKLLPEETERSTPARDLLWPYRDELAKMITRKQDPLKPKYAFQTLKRKYELSVSYETFKRFARTEGLSACERRQIIRIELPPGLETQLDYGKMGLHLDGVQRKNRAAWAFCGILSHSRLPFIQFVYTQDQASFVGSLVDMFEYYDGVTELVSIDNLKSGVIKPDLWDPQINRALEEAAAHYGTFVDPCRVGRPTDKGKVERLVPVARQVYRMLKELHPSATLAELNRHVLFWCREEYGTKEHGTTGVPPAEAFAQEKASLKELPAERFEVPVWKQVTVHSGDQFVTFNKMRFSLPMKWRGKKVWARYAQPFLDLYSDSERIRRYVLTDGQKRYWQKDDFPEGVREMIDGGYPAWIIGESKRFGEQALALITAVLQPHAYLNARRARAMVPLFEQFHGKPYFDEVCRRARYHGVRTPATLKRMFENEEDKQLFIEPLRISQLGSEMIRDIRYYIN
ncbi:MAG: IS21 family transposase [Spirochaetaceae bacterium]|nr:IS21 family transposase [Spirochaetaceae bacterium]